MAGQKQKKFYWNRRTGRVSAWKAKHGRWGLAKKTGRPQMMVHEYKRTSFQPNAITVPALTNQNGVFEFTLGSVINSAEFIALYDVYKILAVKVQLIPNFSMADFTASVQMPRIHTVLDYDDGTTLTTINDYVQYENYKFTQGNRTHSRYLVPAVELGAEQGGVIVSANQKKKQWLDCDAPTVAHRGIKYLIEGGTVDIRYNIKITWYLAFKQVK